MAEVAARALLLIQGQAPPGELAAELEAAWDLRFVVHPASGMVAAQLTKQTGWVGAQGPMTFTSDGDVKGPSGIDQITDDKGTLKFLKIPTVQSLLGKKKN